MYAQKKEKKEEGLPKPAPFNAFKPEEKMHEPQKLKLPGLLTTEEEIMKVSRQKREDAVKRELKRLKEKLEGKRKRKRKAGKQKKKDEKKKRK